jgi:hypothetical protein
MWESNFYHQEQIFIIVPLRNGGKHNKTVKHILVTVDSRCASYYVYIQLLHYFPSKLRLP